MVAMNPQTWDQDVKSLEPGGYLFYDNTKPMPPEKFRPDIVVVGVPLTDMTNKAYNDSRQRQLFKNIVGLGALSMLLDMDPAVIEQLLGEQFKGRDKLIAANIQALQHGPRLGAAEPGLCPIGLDPAACQYGRRSDFHRRQQPPRPWARSMAGRRCARGIRSRRHPLWPRRLPAIAGACGSTGRRARIISPSCRRKTSWRPSAWSSVRPGTGRGRFTATSGPGISLMQEFVGLAYFAEIPAVIFDVQRAGPSTGMPTRTQQTDITACAYASHGDTKHVLLIPEDPYECFEFGALAFDLADRLQTPIFVMLDLEIGMNDRLTKPFVWDDTPAHGPRQGDDGGGAGGGQAVRPLSGRG